MKAKIEFFKHETIPTQLQLKVDDKIINYEKVSDSFAYDFKFYNHTKHEALDISKEIANIMCHQSYDHGSSWRMARIEITEDNFSVIARIIFTIKDIY